MTLSAKKLTLRGPEEERLGDLLKGFLASLGEVCHTLFGADGELALYRAIGRGFLRYLSEKRGISFTAVDPWERYRQIIELFTQYGFYSRVEMGPLEDGKYWMLETGQYAGDVWEEQGAWKRGTPPCPLWSVILHSLGEINYTIVLDLVEFKPDEKGYYSEFHFEPLPRAAGDPIDAARAVLAHAIIPICMHCKRVRKHSGEWEPLESYFGGRTNARFSHGLCPECRARHYSKPAVPRDRP